MHMKLDSMHERCNINIAFISPLNTNNRAFVPSCTHATPLCGSILRTKYSLGDDCLALWPLGGKWREG